MSDLTTLAQHAQTQADNADLPDAERALWWQIAEEVIDYLGPDSSPKVESRLFDE